MTNLKQGVGIICYAPDGKALLAKRSACARDYWNKWEFPGGEVEPGETPIDAAVRELKEELCLTVEPDELVLLGSFEARGWLTYVYGLMLLDRSPAIGEPEKCTTLQFCTGLHLTAKQINNYLTPDTVECLRYLNPDIMEPD